MLPKRPHQPRKKGQGRTFVKRDSILERRLDFLYSLFTKGIEIGEERKSLLRYYQLIDSVNQNKEDFVHARRNLNYIRKKKKVRPQEEFADQRNSRYEKFVSEKRKWHPNIEDLYDLPLAFVKWIDSISDGFKNRLPYENFQLHCEQSEKWLKENVNFTDFDSEYERKLFAVNEFKRIQENSLYFLDKYVMYKGDTTGQAYDNKYKSDAAQKIICFLFDCGYSLMIGKGRQIWFTTTFGALVIKRCNFHQNHFTKLICENLKKQQEILDDKIKFAFTHLPDWMKVSVNHAQQFMMSFAFESPATKGSIAGAESKLVVEAPYETAINGGSPDLIVLDEIGQIPILGKMIQQGLPTLYGFDPIRKRQVPKRQLIGFGTGASVDRGKGEFEKEYKDCVRQWRERNFNYGIIPIFFDWTARPGITQEIYDEKRKIAYDSPDEDKRIVFHQHFPSCIEDMFLTSKETLLSHAEINNLIQKINDLKHDNPLSIQKGMFEPIYDTNQKLGENSFVPFKIIGATWCPADDDDRDAPVTRYKAPEENWKDRYFQGTDPINSASGYSNFSSSIWDNLENTISATLNTRSIEYRNDYLQAVLLNIHYGYPPHLIEWNIGGELISFIDMLGFYRTLLPQAMLPKPLQLNSGNVIGINKKAANSDRIINRLVDMLTAYKANIKIEEFFIQLKTFVRKESNVSNSTGEVKAAYRTDNYKFWKDDVIFSITYAYICAECYNHREPTEINVTMEKKKKLRFVCNQSTGWNTIPQYM